MHHPTPPQKKDPQKKKPRNTRNQKASKPQKRRHTRQPKQVYTNMAEIQEYYETICTFPSDLYLMRPSWVQVFFPPNFSLTALYNASLVGVNDSLMRNGFFLQEFFSRINHITDLLTFSQHRNRLHSCTSTNFYQIRPQVSTAIGSLYSIATIIIMSCYFCSNTNKTLTLKLVL